MILTQIIAVCGSLFFLGMIGWAMYRERLQEAYALIWLATGLVILAFSLFTPLLTLLAKLTGIQTPAFALLLFLLCGILFLLFQLTIVVSKQQGRIMRLTQELALLKEKTDKDYDSIEKD